MKFLLLLLFLIPTRLIFAQENQQKNYLLVRIGADYDYANKRNAFFIIAETGCDAAKNIYSLKKYDFKKNAVNTDGVFYFNHKDTVTNLYNYFLSTTEALNFLSYCDWALFNSYIEIFSGYDNQKDGLGTIQPITTVSSRPVFCFKK
jgi:hypothetical protein